MMEEILNEAQREKRKTTPPNITYPYMMEEWKHILDEEEGEKSIHSENKDAVHINMNENEAETNRYTSEEVID